MKSNIQLIEARKSHDYRTILSHSPGEHLIFACDFHIDEIENGERLQGGYRKGRVINIDHHAPDERMYCHVTSTQLATEWAKECGILDSSSVVFIDHTDCDSILSSAILAGILPPNPLFVEAALGADHTGERNDIAEVLQALDPWRDFALSIRNLDFMLQGCELDPAVKEAMRQRQDKRESLHEKLKQEIQIINKTALLIVEDCLDAVDLVRIFPDVAMIVHARPDKTGSSRWTMKIRLGQAAPAGLMLDKRKIQVFDPNYGGRWNAGSNGRGGGTSLDPRTYVLKLFDALKFSLRD
jgi:hypothetical protein